MPRANVCKAFSLNGQRHFDRLNNHVIRGQINLISTLFYGQNDLSSSNGLHIHTHLITLSVMKSERWKIPVSGWRKPEKNS
jgi:hypothetical protein